MVLNTNSPHRAFTLIELSIVLVIIGLIVGGVLVGKDLIEAAKLRKIASDYEKYNTAAMVFKSKYDCLPGDCAKATQFGFANNGDGDSVINYPYPTSRMESFYLWNHLSTAQLIDGSYSGTVTASPDFSGHPIQAPNVNVPVSPLGGKTGYTIFDGYAKGDWGMPPGNYFVLFSIDGFTGLWHNPALTSLQLSTLDTKYDDGMPFTGKVQDTNGTQGYNSPGCTVSETALNTTYDLSSVGIKCILLWKTQF